MHWFVVNEKERIAKSYDDLLFDINKPEHKFCSSIVYSNLYDFYLQIIISILLDKHVRLKATEVEGEHETYQNPWKFDTINSVIETVKKNTGWKLDLQTSGTTGVPKKVTHSFYSLTKNIKIDINRQNDVWALAYNARHMAGIQVFFQAFLNKSSIINCLGLEKNCVYSCLNKYGITHISATPTFYRLLLPADEIFPEVKQVTFGGEKYSSVLKKNLTTLFPFAKFTNVYASTEAGTLFASEGDYFTIKDHSNSSVKIIENELWIHESHLSNPDNINLINGWYPTGDLVEIIFNDPLKFKFISRKNEMINVGGSKVNPYEVEELILSIPQVKEVKVFGKENSLMGSILCADIISEPISEKNIKKYLKNSLPDYMVPRIIKFVTSIDLTETGKKRRI